MSRIGVCDDNPTMAKNISKIVSDCFSAHGGNFCIEMFTSGNVLINQNKLEPFDVLFLDIDMPKVSGFDIAKSLRDDFSHCLIVFISLHSELVFESFEYQPFFFVRKNCGIPLEESIPPIVEKLVKHLQQDDKVVLEDANGRKKAVSIRDIVCIEVSAHYITYVLNLKGKTEKIRTRGSMQECEEKYKAYDFVRTHKSYLANLKYVTHIKNDTKEVELMNCINIPLSKFYKNGVDEEYTKYLRTRV